MKIYLFLAVVVLALCATGCRKGDSSGPNTTSLNGTWKVVSYQNLISNAIITKASPESGMSGENVKDRDIIVSLNVHDDTLHLQGHTVYNTVSGLFQLGNNESINGHSFGGTKIGEPNWGSWFWDAMNSAGAYRLQKNTLIIYYHFQDNHEGEWGVTLKQE